MILMISGDTVNPCCGTQTRVFQNVILCTVHVYLNFFTIRQMRPVLCHVSW